MACVVIQGTIEEVNVSPMGKDNSISTWVLFGHDQFNATYCTIYYRYDFGQLALVLLTVVLLLEGC